MRMFITGGTGLIGRALTQRWSGEHDICILTRNATHASALPPNIKFVQSLEDVDFNHIDVVVNLAGEPIAEKRWTEAQKSRICQSRWNLTEAIAGKILAATTPPHLLINGSAVGFYGRQEHGPLDEHFHGFYPEFSHDVCARWENLANRCASEQTRVAIVRIGIVLSANGGALAKMLLPFKLGLGGPISDGAQYMSWIHIEDLVALFDHLLKLPSASGIYHGTAPMAVTNQQFTKLLGERLHRPTWFRVPRLILKLALGEMSDLLLYGQQVYPQRVLDSGFTYQYPQLRQALAALDL